MSVKLRMRRGKGNGDRGGECWERCRDAVRRRERSAEKRKCKGCEQVREEIRAVKRGIGEEVVKKGEREEESRENEGNG